MKINTLTKHLLIALAGIFVVLLLTSLVDILLSFLYLRFYSRVLFAMLFGVGGVFAAILAYGWAFELAKPADEHTLLVRRSLFITLVVCGLSLAFLLAPLEGGEYELAFRAFGITLALTGLGMAKMNFHL
jgi:hypothetical protein